MGNQGRGYQGLPAEKPLVKKSSTRIGPEHCKGKNDSGSKVGLVLQGGNPAIQMDGNRIGDKLKNDSKLVPRIQNMTYLLSCNKKDICSQCNNMNENIFMSFQWS